MMTDNHADMNHSPSLEDDSFGDVIEYYVRHNRYECPTPTTTPPNMDAPHNWSHYTAQLSKCKDESDLHHTFTQAIASCDVSAPDFPSFIASFVDSIVRLRRDDALEYEEARSLLLHTLAYSMHKLQVAEWREVVIHVACLLDHQSSWDYILDKYPEYPKVYDYYSLRLIYGGDIKRAIQILSKGASLDEHLRERAVHLERVYGTLHQGYSSALATPRTTPTLHMEGIRNTGIEQVNPSSTSKRSKPDSLEVSEPSRDNTVFVSNLDYHLSLARLKRFFCEEHKLPASCIIKMHRHPDGRFKGFAHIQFDSGDADMDAEAVHQALTLDRTPLDSRPVFVSAFQPNPETRLNKTSLSSIDHSSRNPRVLYVSRLPPTCTEEQLHRVFNKYSGIKQIRMVHRKSGRFRGCAYVEFRSEGNASRALGENGTDIDGYKMCIAISDPSLAPSRGGPQKPKRHISLGEQQQQQQQQPGEEGSDVEQVKAPLESNEAFRASLGLK